MTAVRGQDFPLRETMSNPQGLRPFDPYRTLQLHPAAPRDLIEQAYWLLASSVRSSGVNRSRIEELNAAYGMLVDDDARRSYDEAHGVRAGAGRAARSRSPRLRLFSAKRPSVDYDDYYHVLRIDSEADRRIIQLAYDFWTHGVQGARVERERIEEAHRTLSNPQLRAPYDARRGESVGRSVVEIAERRPEQIRMARHEVAKEVATVPIPAATDVKTGAFGVTPKLEQVGSTTPLADGRRVAAAAVDVPGAIEEARGAPASLAEPARPEPEARPAGAVGRGDARPAPIPGGRAQLEAPATKLPGGRQLAEAQQNRLLQLREDAVTLVDPAPGFAPAAPEQLEAAATLAFISGPRTGERIELAGDVVTLGSDRGCAIVLEDGAANIEREHARLMRRGATYVFSDVAGHDTMIADHPPTLPAVMLEDGDEIQIGVHRMRFAIPC